MQDEDSRIFMLAMSSKPARNIICKVRLCNTNHIIHIDIIMAIIITHQSIETSVFLQRQTTCTITIGSQLILIFRHTLRWCGTPSTFSWRLGVTSLAGGCLQMTRMSCTSVRQRRGSKSSSAPSQPVTSSSLTIRVMLIFWGLPLSWYNVHQINNYGYNTYN